MESLLNQIKRRRIQLGVRQHDMPARIGMSRQQYQRLESRGNPRLGTLELVARGLNAEVVLVPGEKLDAVRTALEREAAAPPEGRHHDDPWADMLGDDE